jgi:ATP-binding cassette subfamily B (MDR/TAP) protein 9
VTRVIVLDKGMIVEDGHPEDLLRNEDAIYAALAKEQGIVARSNETLAQL